MVVVLTMRSDISGAWNRLKLPNFNCPIKIMITYPMCPMLLVCQVNLIYNWLCKIDDFIIFDTAKWKRLLFFGRLKYLFFFFFGWWNRWTKRVPIKCCRFTATPFLPMPVNCSTAQVVGSKSRYPKARPHGHLKQMCSNSLYWVNYNDLTRTSLGIMVYFRGIIPKWP